MERSTLASLLTEQSVPLEKITEQDLKSLFPTSRELAMFKTVAKSHGYDELVKAVMLYIKKFKRTLSEEEQDITAKIFQLLKRVADEAQYLSSNEIKDLETKHRVLFFRLISKIGIENIVRAIYIFNELKEHGSTNVLKIVVQRIKKLYAGTGNSEIGGM